MEKEVKRFASVVKPVFFSNLLVTFGPSSTSLGGRSPKKLTSSSDMGITNILEQFENVFENSEAFSIVSIFENNFNSHKLLYCVYPVTLRILSRWKLSQVAGKVSFVVLLGIDFHTICVFRTITVGSFVKVSILKLLIILRRLGDQLKKIKLTLCRICAQSGTCSLSMCPF